MGGGTQSPLPELQKVTSPVGLQQHLQCALCQEPLQCVSTDGGLALLKVKVKEIQAGSKMQIYG